MESKTYFCMEYPEFDKLVEEKLGFEYESIAENEWNNDSCYRSDNITIAEGNKDFFQQYDLPDIEKKMRGESLDKYSTVSFHDILQYMVWKEMIPEGNYLIEVSW